VPLSQPERPSLANWAVTSTDRTTIRIRYADRLDLSRWHGAVMAKALTV
jgi:hypothetical protein